VISLNEAVDLVLAAVRPVAAERVPLLEALGRTAAADVVSPEDVPSFDNSAMDGFAARGADLAGVARSDGLPIVVEIPAGSVAAEPLGPGDAARIMTGAPLPAGADTVVQAEHTEERDGRVFVRTAPAAGRNVRYAGEDVRRGDVVLPRGAALGIHDQRFDHSHLPDGSQHRLVFAKRIVGRLQLPDGMDRRKRERDPRQIKRGANDRAHATFLARSARN